MLNRIKTFFRRLRSGSFKRMYRNAGVAAKESGRSRISVLLDMIWCILFRGVGYLDYVVFGFADIGKEKRDTYMTMSHNQALVHMLNDRDYYYVFDDKLAFNERFSKYLKRGFIDLQKTDAEGLAAFCGGKTSVFAKQPDSYGGLGVERVTLGQDTDYTELYIRLMEEGKYDIEETAVQDPELDRLCPGCICTLRVVTILHEGVPHVVYTLLRMGSGTSYVDNVTSGGMYTLVSMEDGTLAEYAFCDKTASYYDRHPATGVPFKGFKVPQYREALEMCLEAAL
ncbi:MAG: hypothetical protein IKR95_04130, partial [Oscillospiraceae bacterium]|nr:hypothetical protein [Oscillospiraceae bacterium]